MAGDRQQWLNALILLAMALFVGGGWGAAARWRRPLRLAAVVVFAIAVIAALVEIGRWWQAGAP